MAIHEYPEFTTGQTLTAAELNALTAHAHHRDRLVGRMTGFGVNCGLKGTFSGSTLTISGGLAVDQRGEPLVMDAARTISFPADLAPTDYPFVEDEYTGWSVVLRATDTPAPAPPCTEDGCAGHSTTHSAGVALEVVRGRVSGARFDFPQDSLLAQEPLRLSQTSQPIGSYATLRQALVTRLTNAPGSALVDPDLITDLGATSIASGDLPGVKGYKVGWINMVLFAALDLLRCEALMDVPCARDATVPGVVLGYVTHGGNAWQFDCAYRHAWEPPRGLTRSMLGGTCTDPCGIARDKLEGLLSGYAPPDPPPEPPPSGGGGILIPLPWCPVGKVLIGGRCVNIIEPGELIPLWPPPWWEVPIDPGFGVIDPGWGVIDPMGPLDPWILYGKDRWNYFEDGVFDGGGMLGFGVEDVVNVLEAEILGKGVQPHITVVAAGEFGEIEGGSPSGGFSPSDHILLGVDDAGRVVSTGRVAAVHQAKQVGAAIPAALGAVDEVGKAVSHLAEIEAEVTGKLSRVDGSLENIGKSIQDIQGEFQSFKGGEFDQSGYGARITGIETQMMQMGLQGERISKLEGQVGVVAGGGKGGGIPAGFGRGVSEFAETVIAGLQGLKGVDNKNFERYTKTAARRHAEFEVAMTTGKPDEVGEATMGLLRALRTATKAAGIDRTVGSELDAQLRELEEFYR